jgi:NitT/TauT family transport system ATP-binding protein
MTSHNSTRAVAPKVNSPNMPDVTFLSVDSVTRIYKEGTSAQFKAIDKVSLKVARGEFVSIVGPSGCGKTTLLKMIAGLQRPSRGEIRYRGEVVTNPPDTVGVVFQAPILLPWLRVSGNVMLPGKIATRRRSERREYAKRLAELLKLVGLSDFASRYPAELSGGMQQRVAIARALLRDPELLLMDEPFGALDALTRERLNVELQRIWMSTKNTVVFVTHSIPEAVFLSDRVIVMASGPGRVVADLNVDWARPRVLEDPAALEYQGELSASIRRWLGEGSK